MRTCQHNQTVLSSRLLYVVHVHIFCSLCTEIMSYLKHLVSVKFINFMAEVRRLYSNQIKMSKSIIQKYREQRFIWSCSVCLGGNAWLTLWQVCGVFGPDKSRSWVSATGPQWVAAWERTGIRSTPRLIRPSRLTVLLCLHRNWTTWHN